MEEQTIACRLHTGKVVHAAIETTLKNPYSGNEFKSYKALCGRRPPRHSITYGYAGTREPVNCGACLKKITKPMATIDEAFCTCTAPTGFHSLICKSVKRQNKEQVQ